LAAATAGGAVLSSIPLEGTAHGVLHVGASDPEPVSLGYPGFPNRRVDGHLALRLKD
jgi:hypothetical protein